MLRLDQLAPTMGVASWITMAGGAFLTASLFGEFIAADAWMSRQPISLRSICSSVLELYESRGEITDNEKWQQELKRLRNDCAVALSTKYSPTGTRQCPPQTDRTSRQLQFSWRRRNTAWRCPMTLSTSGNCARC